MQGNSSEYHTYSGGISSTASYDNTPVEEAGSNSFTQAWDTNMEVLFGDDRSLTNLDFGWDYFKAIWSTLDRFTETPTAELSMQLQIYQGAFQAEFALSVLGGYYGGVAVGFAERYIAARLTVAGTQAGGAALGSSAGVFGWFRQLFNRGGTTKLYRAMSNAEYNQLIKTNQFNVSPNSMTGKFFAETIDNARTWGNLLEGKGNFRIVEVLLRKDIADKFMRWGKLDNIGPARYAEVDELVDFIIRPVK